MMVICAQALFAYGFGSWPTVPTLECQCSLTPKPLNIWLNSFSQKGSLVSFDFLQVFQSCAVKMIHVSKLWIAVSSLRSRTNADLPGVEKLAVVAPDDAYLTAEYEPLPPLSPDSA